MVTSHPDPVQINRDAFRAYRLLAPLRPGSSVLVGTLTVNDFATMFGDRICEANPRALLRAVMELQHVGDDLGLIRDLYALLRCPVPDEVIALVKNLEPATYGYRRTELMCAVVYRAYPDATVLADMLRNIRHMPRTSFLVRALIYGETLHDSHRALYETTTWWVRTLEQSHADMCAWRETMSFPSSLHLSTRRVLGLVT